MEIQRTNGTLSIAGLSELSAANARTFRSEACAALDGELAVIEIDLSATSFVDSSGLGALVSIFKTANRCNRNGGVTLRLLHPQPPVQQLFELTRMHHLFEIVHRSETPAADTETAPSPQFESEFLHATPRAAEIAALRHPAQRLDSLAREPARNEEAPPASDKD